MAINNFIPQLWAARVLRAFEKSHVFGNICNRDYEGDISGYGSSVKINSITQPTIAAYTKNSTVITSQVLDDATQTLLIDQANYFAFRIDDVDVAQQKPKIMDNAISQAVYGLRDAMDAYIAGLYANAGKTITTTNVNSKNVLDIISQAAKKLDEGNTPAEGRWIVVAPWVAHKLRLARVAFELATPGLPVLNNGFIGRTLGFDFYVSNNIQTDPYGNTVVLAGVPAAITLAEQFEGLRANELVTARAVQVDGLHVYGTKVVRPNSLCAAYIKEIAEV